MGNNEKFDGTDDGIEDLDATGADDVVGGRGSKSKRKRKAGPRRTRPDLSSGAPGKPRTGGRAAAAPNPAAGMAMPPKQIPGG